MEIKICSPITADEFKEYFKLRFEVLRKPWNEPEGSEKDELEESSVHVCAKYNHSIIGACRLQFVDEHKIRAQIRYRVNLTNELITNIYDKRICEGLNKLYRENKFLFHTFSGVFTVQLSFDKLFYSYIGTNANLKSLMTASQLIDTFINEANMDLFLGRL